MGALDRTEDSRSRPRAPEPAHAVVVDGGASGVRDGQGCQVPGSRGWHSIEEARRRLELGSQWILASRDKRWRWWWWARGVAVMGAEAAADLGEPRRRVEVVAVREGPSGSGSRGRGGSRRGHGDSWRW